MGAHRSLRMWVKYCASGNASDPNSREMVIKGNFSGGRCLPSAFASSHTCTCAPIRASTLGLTQAWVILLISPPQATPRPSTAQVRDPHFDPELRRDLRCLSLGRFEEHTSELQSRQ